ncbi:MAG: F0F1 ATP synthase subunit B [Candidatus Competibacteraceae bacterium]|uniref:ATP synthase subunit b n=1 Tax=Candidatus Contendobacter odensis Run_B_J11 TaxID=1400861 RepID=A0A7U7J4Q2_9GAMM|nr:ATP synthase subunit B [Candidatus Contendobacter odensis]MBK8538120.1 F0F1 ATP synthase subunit B [Candidatus Competibacteraceae bacterium]MBK8752658.1 F0F1 ATP synthase subunit B [Candidatus Competibacteraceae bacterium]CDH45471.1 putative ATP synthase subunit b [Candidatus Contendobacter odensis Run_B_J11]
MLIDWFTVGAQVLNFLILVWLMKHFLYQPILDAIDTREQRIATELANAAAKDTQAQQERDEFQRKNAEFDQQRGALLKQATDEAQAERERLLDEARKAAAVLHAKRQETLNNEMQHLHQDLRRRTQQEVFAITRKALTDLAGTSLEERMVEVFAGRLRDLDETAKERLISALKASPNPVIVRTTFDLPPAQRASTEAAIKATLGAETPVQFGTAPDLISGIELATNGQKVAWSIADYVASLEKSVEELLKEKDKPEANAEPQPEEPQSEATRS